MTERLRVSTSDEKYTVIQKEDGGMTFLRHGQPWPAADRDFSGVGLILTLAQDLVEARSPIQMILFCPACGLQHVDKANWASPPHRTHQCQGCGHLWRPAAVCTEGIADLPLGTSDTRPAVRGRLSGGL